MKTVSTLLLLSVFFVFPAMTFANGDAYRTPMRVPKGTSLYNPRTGVSARGSQAHTEPMREVMGITRKISPMSRPSARTVEASSRNTKKKAVMSREKKLDQLGITQKRNRSQFKAPQTSAPEGSFMEP